MEWLREEIRAFMASDSFGYPFAVVLIVAGVVIPLVLLAVGMSFIVPVEPWVAVLAVLAGLPIQWRLVSRDVPFAVLVGAGAVWVFGAFVAGRPLGPVPAIAVIFAASRITIWAIGRLEDFNAAAEGAVYDAFLNATYVRRASPP